jgi:hypothetical protein
MPARIAATGMVPKTVAAPGFRANVARSTSAWGTLIRESGFHPE